MKLTDWQWDRFFSEYFGSSLSVSFHRGSMFFLGHYSPYLGLVLLFIEVS
jgi:hypothetical protein